MRVLLTGFEPFGGEPINPSERALCVLSETAPSGIEVETVTLPVAFGPDVERLGQVWDRFQPDCVLSLGQNGGAAELRLERYAHNLKREAGSAVEEPIHPDGPAAYATSLPISDLVGQLRNARIPAAESRDAGVYVCNHLYYQSLHRAATHGEPTPVLFIHLPYLPDQATRHAGQPSMALNTMAMGVRLILKALVR
jgi:pyroglutamyl-peptidase